MADTPPSERGHGGAQGAPSAPPPAPSAPADDADADTDAQLTSDLHDVFGMMYAGSEWDTDDEDVLKRDSDGFDLPRLLHLLDGLVSSPSSPPARKKRRIFPARARAPHLVTSTQPLPALPPSSTYEPFSPLPLLSRLRTYGAAGMSPGVPSAVGPAACALHGWISAGPDAVVCARGCGAAWGVAGLDTLSPRIRLGVVARLSGSLSSRHAAACAWRTTPSPPGLIATLRRTLHPLTGASLSALARAVAQQTTGPSPIRWTSPASPAEIDALALALTRYSRPTAAPGTAAAAAEIAPIPPLAAALALFGWYPHDPTFPAHHVVAHGPHTDIVACRVCRRRVGLWAFREGAGAEGAGAAAQNSGVDAASGAGASPSTTTTAHDAASAGRTLDLGAAHLTWCPLRADASDTWWRECVLLHARGAEDNKTPKRDAANITALLGIAERPVKRWRRRGPDRPTAAPPAAAAETRASA